MGKQFRRREFLGMGIGALVGSAMSPSPGRTTYQCAPNSSTQSRSTDFSRTIHVAGRTPKTSADLLPGQIWLIDDERAEQILLVVHDACLESGRHCGHVLADSGDRLRGWVTWFADADILAGRYVCHVRDLLDEPAIRMIVKAKAPAATEREE